MLVTLKRATIFVFGIYCLLTCYTAYLLLIKNYIKSKPPTKKIWSLPDEEDWNPWGEEFEREKSTRASVPTGPPPKVANLSSSPSDHNVEIWGKAAIGLYLWEHIFNGKLEKKMEGLWSYGFRKIDNIKFKFRTGPGVVPAKVPTDVRHLVLVLNGRSADKVAHARAWLDLLPQLRHLRGVALLLLGNEQCRNDWLLPYLSSHGGRVNLTFLVYDSPLVDGVNVFQWPLGVATYRNFPKPDPSLLDLESSRPFRCNFVGTVYPGSSRHKLMGVLERANLTQQCPVKPRSEWLPKESRDSLEAYTQSLRLSDLTLSPVGVNTECYRLYEAMTYGSVPVAEDVMTPGRCASPLRLLKARGAPFLLVKDWAEDLPALLLREQLLTPTQKVRRRLNLVRWYETFKLQLREEFVGLLQKKFFSEGG